MIVKLVNVHDHAQYIEADSILTQSLANGGIDLECNKRGNEQDRLTRFIISEDMEGTGYWKRAYIMENGKTVDTIRATLPPTNKTKRISP